MSAYMDRASARDALLALPSDLEAVLEALGQFERTPSDRPVPLDRATVRRALGAFTRGELSPALLERWAEAVHSADDVELDSDDRDFLSEVLFELSTPELFGSMEEVVASIQERDRREPPPV